MRKPQATIVKWDSQEQLKAWLVDDLMMANNDKLDLAAAKIWENGATDSDYLKGIEGSVLATLGINPLVAQALANKLKIKLKDQPPQTNGEKRF